MTPSEERIEEQIIQPLCYLSLEVAIRCFDFPKVASDCICASGPARKFESWGFQHDHRIMEFITQAVREALQAKAGPPTDEQQRLLNHYFPKDGV